MTNITKTLAAIPSDPDLLVDNLAFLDDLNSRPSADEVESLFRFVETHRDDDLGAPGPIVHYLERFFPHYIPALMASLLRQPTDLTLWMVNRILNRPSTDVPRTDLLKTLKNVAEDPNQVDSLRSAAANFMTLHE